MCCKGLFALDLTAKVFYPRFMFGYRSIVRFSLPVLMFFAAEWRAPNMAKADEFAKALDTKAIMKPFLEFGRNSIHTWKAKNGTTLRAQFLNINAAGDEVLLEEQNFFSSRWYRISMLSEED